MWNQFARDPVYLSACVFSFAATHSISGIGSATTEDADVASNATNCPPSTHIFRLQFEIGLLRFFFAACMVIKSHLAAYM